MEEMNNNVVDEMIDEINNYDNDDVEVTDLSTTDGSEESKTGTAAVVAVVAGVVAGTVAVVKNRKKIAQKWRDMRRKAMEKKLAKYDELDKKYAAEMAAKEHPVEDDFDDDFFDEVDGAQPETEGNNQENPTQKKGK